MFKKILSLTIIIVLIAAIGIFIYQLYFPKTGYLIFRSGEIKELIKGATIYASPNCRCCSFYADYLRNQGIPVKVSYLDDISTIKSRYKIPINMQSCHTTIIDNYFIEGHVPIEAIIKLMKEKPNIAGISLPGMPPGSPGMTGIKRGPFQIYSIGHNGVISLFTST